MRSAINYFDDPRIVAAVDELKALISDRYPDAIFDVSAGEDPGGVDIVVTVDIDDPDEVTDLVIDRTLHMQVYEGLPVYVTPIRTIERIIEAHRLRIEANALLPSALD